MNLKFALIVGSVALVGSAAHAQLVFGHTLYSSANPGLSGAYYLDITSGNATQLWIGQTSPGKTNALAADEAGRTLYSVDSARVMQWSYNTVGTTPTLINGLYRMGSNGTVYATGVDGLAFANGKLYGYTNYNAGGSANFVEDGIYLIDPSITTGGTPNMSLVWQHSDLAYNLQGLEFNSADGLFYATNTSANNAHGIYTIDVFGDGSINKVADFDPFLANPDGLAIGGGHIWLTGKQSGDTTLKIVGYNLSAQTYDEAFELDGFSSNARSTGATWAPGVLSEPVPEPATLAALGMGALALLRRKKKNKPQ